MFNNIAAILSVAVNLIIVIGLISREVGKKINKGYAHTFFGGDKVIVYFPVRSRKDNDNRSLISDEVFHSCILLSRFFAKNKIAFEFIGIGTNDTIIPSQNALFLGGPRAMKYAHENLSNDKNFKFTDDRGKWKITDLKKKSEIKLQENGTVNNKSDLVYLNKFKDNGNNYIIIGGIKSLGTLGGCAFITNISNIRKLIKKHADKNISGILHTEIDIDKMITTISQIYLDLKEY